MKRDWDQVRRILLAVEESPGGQIRASDFMDDDEGEINYHMNLLIEAGIVDGMCVTTKSSVRSCRVNRMTWKGHELLDSIRKQSAWNGIKKMAIDKGVGLTIDTIFTLAKRLVEL